MIFFQVTNHFLWNIKSFTKSFLTFFCTSVHFVWVWECLEAGRGDWLETDASQFICNEGPVWKFSSTGWGRSRFIVWVRETQFILVLFIILFYMNNCKPTFTPACIMHWIFWKYDKKKRNEILIKFQENVKYLVEK